jgi:hypothetical protein
MFHFTFLVTNAAQVEDEEDFDSLADCFFEDGEEYVYDEDYQCFCWYDEMYDAWYWLDEDTGEWLLVEEDDEDEEIYWEEDEAA